MQISLEYLKEQKKVITQDLGSAQRQEATLSQNLANQRNVIQQLVGQLGLVNRQIEDAQIEEQVNGDEAAASPSQELSGQGAGKKSRKQKEAPAPAAVVGLKSPS